MIPFGTAFTGAVCWAMGCLLFQVLGIRLKRVEHDLLAAVTGASLLSLAVFALCTVKLARAPVFLAFGAVAIPLGCIGVRHGGPKGQFPPLPRWWKWLFVAAFSFYAAVYLSNSLAPELSPDGSTYHLGLVARYFRQHGFERLTTSMYANLSQGMEMLFLFAFAFGRHSAAATVHCLFLFTLPLLMLGYARRIGRPRAGVCGAMLVYLSPLAGIDGVSAYNDVGLATAGFAMFYLLEIWRDTRDDRLLIPIGLLAGFCFAIKYTGFVAPLYAVAIVAGSMRRVGAVAASASAVALPWLIKNWIWIGNPFSPFLNRLFPNPFVHISFEENYRAYLHTYGLASLKPLFWIVTVTGELGGQIGPLFLLAPLGLLSLRWRAGRHLVAAALVFLLPYPQNIGARFLIPATPFAALAMAVAFEFSGTILALMVVAAAVLAWPRIIDKYRAPTGGWQIATVPWKAALHLIPAEGYLMSRSAEMVLVNQINQYVPHDKRLWSSKPVAESYTVPDILVNYYSAEGETIQDILLTAVQTDLQPLWNLRFQFPARTVQHLRAIETAASKDDIWSIGEARFFHGETELQATSAAAPLAVDRNPVTRWRSWESIHPGMHVDFEFAGAVTIDRVEFHCSHDQWKIQLQLEGIAAPMEKLEDPPLGDLRRVATRTIQSRGIDYLLIGGDFSLSGEIANDAEGWGLVQIARHDADRIYRIK